VNKTWALGGRQGLKELFDLGVRLRQQRYHIVYDAHANMRSLILRCYLAFFSRIEVLIRKKQRVKRLALFCLRWNLFPRPFKGMMSYLEPLEKLGVEKRIYPVKLNLTTIEVKWGKPYIVLAPSAAWEMKRWPLGYFKELIMSLPDKNFIILGGKGDVFCQELEELCPDRVVNLAGKLSFNESMAVVYDSSMLISADTGILHVADLMGVKGIALIGPTAFGFPSGEQIEVLQVDLSCRPCSKDGRGRCLASIYKKCMVEITPQLVVKKVHQIFRR
jgi:heptosyltransferase-2